MNPDQISTLINKSRSMLEHSYCPYSKFPVGAALLCSDGTIFTGCNVENAAYPTGICAERTAYVKAISEGHKSFVAIAIASELDDFCSPCGVCRQFMREFGLDLQVILTKPDGKYQVHKLDQLLPLSFGPSDLHPHQSKLNV